MPLIFFAICFSRTPQDLKKSKVKTKTLKIIKTGQRPASIQDEVSETSKTTNTPKTLSSNQDEVTETSKTMNTPKTLVSNQDEVTDTPKTLKTVRTLDSNQAEVTNTETLEITKTLVSNENVKSPHPSRHTDSEDSKISTDASEFASMELPQSTFASHGSIQDDSGGSNHSSSPITKTSSEDSYATALKKFAQNLMFGSETPEPNIKSLFQINKHKQKSHARPQCLAGTESSADSDDNRDHTESYAAAMRKFIEMQEVKTEANKILDSHIPKTENIHVMEIDDDLEERPATRTFLEKLCPCCFGGRKVIPGDAGERRGGGRDNLVSSFHVSESPNRHINIQ